MPLALPHHALKHCTLACSQPSYVSVGVQRKADELRLRTDVAALVHSGQSSWCLLEPRLRLNAKFAQPVYTCPRISSACAVCELKLNLMQLARSRKD